MHQSAHPRNASPPPSALARDAVPRAVERGVEAVVVGAEANASERAPALPLLAVVVANVALAFGPWFVRLADTGPVAAAFWRMALALPLIVVLAIASGTRAATLRLPGRMWLLLALAGVAFAMDLGSWHVGILQTTLANATLFGNSATFIFPI